MLEMLEKNEEANATIEIVESISRSDETVKDTLWSLCYEPIEFLKRRGYDELNINPVDFQEALLNVCREKYENFIFASKEPKLYTYGVDLRIENPIIRDIIVERCVAISEDSDYLRECISNICTRRDSFEYKELYTCQ